MQKNLRLKTVGDWLKQIFFGMCIGAADIVPGISGGTMALILGIYEDFIYSIKSLGSKGIFFLLSFKLKEFSKRVPWDFLLSLVIGISFSFALFSRIIQTALNNPVYCGYLFALFAGLVFASLFICFRKVKVWNRALLGIFLLGALLTYFFSSTQLVPPKKRELFNVQIGVEKLGEIQGKKLANYSFKEGVLLNVTKSNLEAMLSKGEISPFTLVYKTGSGEKGIVSDFISKKRASFVDFWLIFCGAAAVSAMLLPGISGSYILTVFGVYPLAIGAVADFLKEGDFDSFVILCNLGVGIVIGALVFSKAIAFLLKYMHDITLSLLLGFMVGALHTVWPFFTYEYFINPLKISSGAQMKIISQYMPSLSTFELYYFVGAALVGFFAVFVLESISNKVWRAKKRVH